jgi:hypothetical protein
MLKNAKLRIHRMNVKSDDFLDSIFGQGKTSDFSLAQKQSLAKLFLYIKELEGIVTGEEGGPLDVLTLT